MRDDEFLDDDMLRRQGDDIILMLAPYDEIKEMMENDKKKKMDMTILEESNDMTDWSTYFDK